MIKLIIVAVVRCCNRRTPTLSQAPCQKRQHWPRDMYVHTLNRHFDLFRDKMAVSMPKCYNAMTVSLRRVKSVINN